MRKKHVPLTITHVDGDRFQVVGEARVYEDPVDAIQRARRIGPGAEAIRLSDGKPLCTIPGYIPPPPKDLR